MVRFKRIASIVFRTAVLLLGSVAGTAVSEAQEQVQIDAQAKLELALEPNALVLVKVER